jgi:hypothetical protein
VVQATVSIALGLLDDPQGSYRRASSSVRRLLNQAFFESM